MYMKIHMGWKENDMEKLKSLPKKIKLAIIISASAVAAVALILILIFAVIIPAAAPKTDVSKYLKVSFDSKTQYSGNISGVIEYDVDGVLSDIPHEEDQEIVLTGSLDRLLRMANFEYTTEGESGKSGKSSQGSIAFSGHNSGDVLEVSVSWPDDGESKSLIAREEKICGFNIDKAPKTITVKLEDYIKQQGVEVKNSAELDILDYIKDNGLVITLPKELSGSEGLTVGIDTFRTKIGDYTVTNKSIHESSILVYDKNGEYYSTVFLDIPENGNCGEGQIVTVDYSDDNRVAEASGLLLTGEPVVYTVEKTEALTAESAKSNLDSVKKNFTENASELDTDVKDGDKTEISSVYFTVNKKDKTFNKLVFVYENKGQGYFRTAELSRDGFFSGDRFVFYGYTELNSKEKSADEAVKETDCLDSKNTDWSVTKVG